MLLLTGWIDLIHLINMLYFSLSGCRFLTQMHTGRRHSGCDGFTLCCITGSTLYCISLAVHLWGKGSCDSALSSSIYLHTICGYVKTRASTARYSWLHYYRREHYCHCWYHYYGYWCLRRLYFHLIAYHYSSYDYIKEISISFGIVPPIVFRFVKGLEYTTARGVHPVRWLHMPLRLGKAI